MRSIGMLVVLTLALALALITACGGGEATQKKTTPRSPIASESGWRTKPGRGTS